MPSDEDADILSALLVRKCLQEQLGKQGLHSAVIVCEPVSLQIRLHISIVIEVCASKGYRILLYFADCARSCKTEGRTKLPRLAKAITCCQPPA